MPPHKALGPISMLIFTDWAQALNQRRSLGEAVNIPARLVG